MSSNASSLPIILALDTCTENCSAALQTATGQWAERVDAPREHSQRLLPMVQGLLQQAEIGMKDVGLIAYGRGPGSFTGIRICTSMTQGLALAREIPVIGISTLAAMAQQAISEHGAEQVLCAIDARMSEVYWAAFKAVDGMAVEVTPEQVSVPDAVTVPFENATAIYCCGTGFETYPDLLQLKPKQQLLEAVKYPDASAMLALAVRGFVAGEATSVDDLKPVYLRDTVAWKKLPGRE